MEIQAAEIIEEKKTKAEEIIGKSIKAGNFSEIGEYEHPNRDIFMINLDKVKDYVQYLPILSQGHGFSGGTARGALLGLLGEKPPKIRDFDVEFIKDMAPKQEGTEEMKIYLEKIDSSAIQYNNDLISYFSTRDFTINEVFLYGNNLYYSRSAIEDTENKVIRPTDYEIDKSEYYHNRLSPRMLVRALLLEIEFIKLYGKGNHEDIEEWQWRNLSNSGFNVSLGLEKASQKRIEIEFLKKMFEVSVVNEEDIPEGISRKGLQRLANLARHWMLENGRDDFVFSDDYFNQECDEVLIEQDDAKFDDWYRKSLSRVIKTKHISESDLE